MRDGHDSKDGEERRDTGSRDGEPRDAGRHEERRHAGDQHAGDRHEGGRHCRQPRGNEAHAEDQGHAAKGGKTSGMSGDRTRPAASDKVASDKVVAGSAATGRAAAGKAAPGKAGAATGPDAPAAGGAGVVRLAECGSRSATRILAELRTTWDGLRGKRAVPDRADIEPRALRSALSYAFILERIAPGAARFRVAGRHLIDLMGMEVRGMPLCALFNPASRGHLSDVLETVFAGPQIAELTLLSEAGYARPALSARMLLLPLRSDLGDITRVLGAIVSEGAIGCPPRRFDLTGEELTPVIVGARTLQPSPSRPGFAESPEPWRPAPSSRPADRAATKPDRATYDATNRRRKGAPPAGHPTGPTGADVRPDSVGGSGNPSPDLPPDGGDSPEARRRGFRVIPGGI